MAVRRDMKNRILGRGEYQKKDGRYMYRYIDNNGKSRFVYSWTLTTTDRVPKGKKRGPCLRELELQIAKDLQDGINTLPVQKSTLNSFFDDYINQRQELKISTISCYKYVYKKYVYDVLGTKKLIEIKYSDIRRFYNSLVYNKKLNLNTVEILHNILHPIFTLAVRDGYIRTNPTDGVMSEMRKANNCSSNKRRALTISEQNAFLDFLNSDEKYSRWRLLFTFCLGTGCRIGETLALTWENCDFTNGIIKIEHNLAYIYDEHIGKSELHISTPKTKSSIREIPMFKTVKKILIDEKFRQMREGFNTSVIDGVSGFVFSNKNNKVYKPRNVNYALEHLIEKYNLRETLNAQKEHRDPLLLPHFTVHNLRHTFCTRMCENEVNIKVIQEIMGHSNISVTMDIYAEATREKKKETFDDLEDKIYIG